MLGRTLSSETRWVMLCAVIGLGLVSACGGIESETQSQSISESQLSPFESVMLECHEEQGIAARAVGDNVVRSDTDHLTQTERDQVTEVCSQMLISAGVFSAEGPTDEELQVIYEQVEVLRSCLKDDLGFVDIPELPTFDEVRADPDNAPHPIDYVVENYPEYDLREVERECSEG